MNSEKHIIQIVRIDVAPQVEDEFNKWYEEEHIPNLLKVPGVIWAKRGINTGKGPKYIAIYEHESRNVRESEAYQKASETDWTNKMAAHFLNFEREIYEIL